MDFPFLERAHAQAEEPPNDEYSKPVENIETDDNLNYMILVQMVKDGWWLRASPVL